MEVRKAHSLIDNILNTHIDALTYNASVDVIAASIAREALDNARQDLHGLLHQVIIECVDDEYNTFDHDADEAVDITREV